VISRNKRAKRLALRLDTKKRVIRFTIPPRTSLGKARLFLIQNEQWIQKNLGTLPQPIYFEHGIEIPVFGTKRTLNITHDETLRKTDIILRNKEIIVLTNKEDPAPRLVRFLKQMSKERLTDLSHEKAAHIQKKISKVSVRDTKSRWGSCGYDGSLSYSWRLIFAPYASFDYLVAHEVAHLKHMDHSPAFWKCCNALAANAEKGKKWLNSNSAELMRYPG